MFYAECTASACAVCVCLPALTWLCSNCLLIATYGTLSHTHIKEHMFRLFWFCRSGASCLVLAHSSTAPFLSRVPSLFPFLHPCCWNSLIPLLKCTKCTDRRSKVERVEWNEVTDGVDRPHKDGKPLLKYVCVCVGGGGFMQNSWSSLMSVELSFYYPLRLEAVARCFLEQIYYCRPCSVNPHCILNLWKAHLYNLPGGMRSRQVWAEVFKFTFTRLFSLLKISLISRNVSLIFMVFHQSRRRLRANPSVSSGGQSQLKIASWWMLTFQPAPFIKE